MSSPAEQRPRIAFVVQRCGEEVTGGAESLCLQIASRMSRYWQTEVLTTCALDYMTWDNYYAPGVYSAGGTAIRRFQVDQPRNVSQFNRLSEALAAKGFRTPLREEETWMRAQGPLSSSLFEYISARRDDYEAFVFFGYLYATTYFGLPPVAEKAYLAPLAHDEWPIRLGMWDDFFALPQGFIYQTEEERAFVEARFPQLGVTGPVVGIGIEPPAEIDTAGFLSKYEIDYPFLLYAGRIDEQKGCGELFSFFSQFTRETATGYKLLTIGAEAMAVAFHDDIAHLGFVSEGEKWAALSACDWLMMPSPYESLCIALLEGWSVGRPAVVSSRSSVTTGHCKRSHGGLWYSDYSDWKQILLTCNEATRKQLGCQGRRYVTEQYSWHRIEDAYARIIAGVAHA